MAFYGADETQRPYRGSEGILIGRADADELHRHQMNTCHLIWRASNYSCSDFSGLWRIVKSGAVRLGEGRAERRLDSGVAHTALMHVCVKTMRASAADTAQRFALTPVPIHINPEARRRDKSRD